MTVLQQLDTLSTVSLQTTVVLHATQPKIQLRSSRGTSQTTRALYYNHDDVSITLVLAH